MHQAEHSIETKAFNNLALKGEWEPLAFKFRNLPVHVALLHTGKVLGFGGSGNEEVNLHEPCPAELWDPENPQETKIIDQKLAGDIFCSGHSALPDGRILIAGGTFAYEVKRFPLPIPPLENGIPLPPFAGIEQAYVFDPQSETFTRVEDMSVGRWYPTLVTLGDGRVLAMAGTTKYFPWVVLRKLEVYAPGEGWSHLHGADRWMPLYPRLHLLPNGQVFYAGTFNIHYVYPFRLTEFPTSILDLTTRRWTKIGPPNQPQREEGTSVLLPLLPPDYRPRILLVGGGTTVGTEAENTCEIIDLDDAQPNWRPTQPMKHARYYAYPVLLPNRTVLILGGRAGHKEHAKVMVRPAIQTDGDWQPPAQDPLAVREPELFNPEDETWTTLAPMACDRLYHASALLLPDGRVLTAGSNPLSGVNELRIEIYHPPYLFQGPRPEIQRVPDHVSYGQLLEIETKDASGIEQVVLIRPTVTTHCVNTDQRYVELAIQDRTKEKLRAMIPTNPNLLPPGYYMLFILGRGIPSRAKFVQIQPN